MSFVKDRSRFPIAAVVTLTVFVGLALVLLGVSGADLGFERRGISSVAYPLGIAAFWALLFIRPRVEAAGCQTCGRPCLPSWNAKSDRLCPRCRHRTLLPGQRRRRDATTLAVVAILFLILSVVLLRLFAALIPAEIGGATSPAMAIGLFAILFGSFSFAMIVRILAGRWRMTRPGHALQVARALAGAPGRETTFGAVSVYVFGEKDPTAMIKGQMETCRNRFATLVGEPVETERSLRVLAFEKRDAFDAFFRRAFLFGSNIDGFFVPWTPATIVMTTEFPSHGLANPERVVRTLLSYYFLDHQKRRRLPQWLQSGLGNHLATGGDKGELARLNRRMLASLSRQNALGVDDLFRDDPRTMLKLQRDWEDHDNFTALTQLTGQAWSIVEHLWNLGTKEGNHQRFRSFLEEVDPREPHEETFKRHFSYDYSTLLESWRVSVVANGVGTHEPLPSYLQFVLWERAIPTIMDRDAKPIARIQAVREMGRLGYVAGTEVLIDLLGTDDTMPSEEIVGTLEAISGLALGLDEQAWRNWLGRLPEEARHASDLAQTS